MENHPSIKNAPPLPLKATKEKCADRDSNPGLGVGNA